MLTNFDIYAAAGGSYKAVAESFPVTASGSGTIAVTFTPTAGNAQVSGLEVYSGATAVQQINCGEPAGGTITVNPAGTFTNQGTLSASNGETLTLDGTWSNAGTISATSGTLNWATAAMPGATREVSPPPTPP